MKEEIYLKDLSVQPWLHASLRSMSFQLLVWWEAWQDLSSFIHFCTLFFKEMNSNNEFLIMHNPRWLLIVSQLLIFLNFFCFCLISFVKIAALFKSLLLCTLPQNLSSLINISTLYFNCRIAISLSI